MDARQWLETELLHRLLAGHQHRRGAVGDLAGVGGADDAVLRQRLQAADGVQVGVPADAFVHIVQGLSAVIQVHVHRQDFLLETARFGSGGGAAVGVVGELVQVVFADAVLLGHALGAHELAEVLARVAATDLAGERIAQLLGHGDRRTDRHLAHGFHATGDHQVLGAAHHRLGGEMDGLLGGTALPVDGHARHRLRQP